MRRRLGLVMLAVVATFGGSTAHARKAKPKPTACVGTYVLAGAPLVGSASTDALVIGSTISSLSGCPAVRVRLKASRKATTVAAKWASCPGITGKAAFAGRIPAGCETLTGVFKAKKAKIRRKLTATRSPCGDGLVDPTRETCEGPVGCAVGQLCQANCTCSGTNCGPNAPQAQFTRSGTPTAGQAITFDASGSSDPDGETLIHAWTFGDDQRGGGAQVAHVYATAGQKTVRLTVSDGCGHTATHEETIDVAAGPAPTGTTTARGRVLDVSGTGLGGAQVRAEPGGTATSDGAGDVTVSVGQGVPVRISVTKPGYAAQVILTEVPDVPNPDAYFEATLLQRAAGQTLADAAAGGTVMGADGAQVALPANALTDANGDPVSGPVDVFVTPVDVVRRINAFPGRANGLTPDGEQGPIVTYGTVEYAFEQNGQPLNLVPGTLATIEIPAYATKDLDGSLLAPGDTYPLWALDPATGQWVAEGDGTIVESGTSPTGLALRGQVTHFSFWNHDRGTPPYQPKPKCMVDTNADGILEDLTGTGHCWHGGTGPEQPDDGFFGPQPRAGRGGGVVAPKFPNWLGQEVLPAIGGKILPVPSEMDITLHSRAQGGLLQGSKTIRGAAGVTEDVIVVLEPVNASGDHITIPFQTERDISDTDSVHVYDFDGVAGERVFVTVENPTAPTSTAADVTMLLPDDSELGPVEYQASVQRPARMGLVLPSNGNYRIVVTLAANAFDGRYRIIVDHTASFPIVVATSPGHGTTGVSPSANLQATFSQTVSEFLSMDAYVASLPVNGTTNVTGDTATFDPTSPFPAGAAVRAVVDGFRSPGDTQPTGFPRNYTWVFNVAETAGTLVPVGPGNNGFPSVGGSPTGTVFAVWQRGAASPNSGETWAAQYTPGTGWSLPTRFFDGALIGPQYGVALAVTPTGAVAIFPGTSNLTQTSVYESRYTPATGWSEPTVIENVTTTFSQAPAVGADAAGNVIALFGTTAPAGQGDVYWSRHTPGGSWTVPEILIDDVRRPGLAVGPTGHAIAWAEQLSTGATLVRRYTPGQAWSAVDTFETIDIFDGISGAVDGSGNIFFMIASGGQTRVRRYEASGQAWSAIVNVQSSPSCRSDMQVVTAANGHAFVIGCTSAAPGPGVFAARYSPGSGWAASELLSSATGVTPSLGVDTDGNAVAAWINVNSSSPGQYKRFSVGSGWEATAHDFPRPSGSLIPRFAVSGTGAAVMTLSGPFVTTLQGVRLP